MKRSILGVFLLVGLLVLGLYTSSRMERRHTPIQDALNTASEKAEAEDWDMAFVLLNEATRRWEQGWDMDAALADHAPMKEIDSLFARLGVFCREENREEFSAGCRELSRLVQAMTDAHQPSWRNLF